MDAVTQSAMQQLEQHAFAQGVEASELMEQAGYGIAVEIRKRFPITGLSVAYIGSGNNGGDALVALKHLHRWGWKIHVRTEHSIEQLNELPQLHLTALGEDALIAAAICEKRIKASLPIEPVILLDGLLGIGASGALRSPLVDLATEMNLYRSLGAKAIAMDLPSGIHANTGEVFPHAVIADHTCSVALPKVGILSETAINHVGSISHTSLSALNSPTTTGHQLITPQSYPKHHRPFDLHKGMAGRVGVIAGSEGMLGAAVITATGALRAGAGLVTIFCHEDIAPHLSIKAPAEVMVCVVDNTTPMSTFENFDALAIGPGLGSTPQSSAGQLESLLTEIITHPPCPIVIDADGLNFVARHKLLKSLPRECVITPHPGEMARLYPDAPKLTREGVLNAVSDICFAVILFKGSRTLIKQGHSPIYVNGTGCAGMATAGQGDLLTGVISGLMAQSYTPLHAASMAAWLCGRASEIATSDTYQESLITSDTASHIGYALKEWNIATC